MKYVALGFVGLFFLGRLSRRSAAHPVNAVPATIASSAVYEDSPESSDPMLETAEIPGSMILGEGGGEIEHSELRVGGAWEF
jgi:hypothetical protein